MTGDLKEELKIDAFCREGTLAIQNGFACGDWNGEGKGILQLRPFNITNSGQVDLGTTKYVDTDRNVEAYILRERDVVFNNTNSEELVGKTALWTSSQRAVLSNHMTILRVVSRDKLNPEFLSFYLLKRWFDGYFHSVCRRHVNQASVSIERLRDTGFPPFDIAEQRKIAGALGVVQRAMEQQERLLALTAELKKALLHKLFTEGLRGEPKKQTDIGPVPQSWELVKLDDVFETQLGKMLSQKAHIGNDPKPYLRNKNVQWGQIDITDLLEMNFNERERAKFALRPGDLLICEGGEPGRAAIWHGELKECYYQKALHRLRPKDQRITNEYLAHWLAFSFQLQNLYGVAGASSTIAHLPESQLKALPIPMPKRSEQDEICVTLEGVVSKVAHHRRKHATLASLFHTLLYQLMSAQIRVHDLDMDKLECILERGDVSPLSEGVTRRADQSADSSAHSKKENGDTSPQVTIRKVK
jgi:type I restriction enzyme S subunit